MPILVLTAAGPRIAWVPAGRPVGMQPHPSVASDGTLIPDRTLLLELSGAEVDALIGLLTTHEVATHDLRHLHQGDQERVDQLEREIALADRINTALDAGVAAPVMFGLPEADVLLRLPLTREVLCGPGVQTAAAVHDALVGSGQSERDAWSGAAAEVARDLTAAVLVGVRGSSVRPLARLHRAILREVAAHPEG